LLLLFSTMSFLAGLHQIPNPLREQEVTEGVRHSPPALLVLLSLLVVFAPLLDGGTTHLAALIIRVFILALVSVYLWQGFRIGAITWHRLSAGPAVAAFLGLLNLVAMSHHFNPVSVAVCCSDTPDLYAVVAFLSDWRPVAVLLIVVVSMGLFRPAGR
jgi:hypothetical protein